jgi:dienelactone hydrolase
MGLSSFVVAHRNDGEGPTVVTGRSTLATLEADDVREAVRHALQRGARRVVLFGWSMGAAISLQLAADAESTGWSTRSCSTGQRQSGSTVPARACHLGSGVSQPHG